MSALRNAAYIGTDYWLRGGYDFIVCFILGPVQNTEDDKCLRYIVL